MTSLQHVLDCGAPTLVYGGSKAATVLEAVRRLDPRVKPIDLRSSESPPARGALEAAARRGLVVLLSGETVSEEWRAALSELVDGDLVPGVTPRVLVVSLAQRVESSLQALFPLRLHADSVRVA